MCGCRATRGSLKPYTKPSHPRAKKRKEKKSKKSKSEKKRNARAYHAIENSNNSNNSNNNNSPLTHRTSDDGNSIANEETIVEKKRGVCRGRNEDGLDDVASLLGGDRLRVVFLLPRRNYGDALFVVVVVARCGFCGGGDDDDVRVHGAVRAGAERGETARRNPVYHEVWWNGDGDAEPG